MDNKSSNNVAINEHYCSGCDYRTSKIFNYRKHLLTAKHLMITNDNIKVADSSNNIFICECGNKYKNRHNLSRHKKSCLYELTCKSEEPEQEPVQEPEPEHEEQLIPSKVIFDMIKENQEIKNMLIEQSKQFLEQNKQVLELQKDNSILINRLIEKESSITNNNNTTNNNNQKFNLNFFLNETCKDAMNIQEFIENIKITFQDLLKIGNDGFVDGLSDIFVKRLRDLDVTKRPIHCTDMKRETIFMKEEDTWNKDDKDNSKLKGAIEKVEYKNVAALRNWCIENPDANVNNTDNNLLRDKIYLQTLQGDERSRDRIIKNISKEIIIDK